MAILNLTIASLIFNALFLAIILFLIFKEESLVFKGLIISFNPKLEFGRDEQSAFVKLYKENRRLKRRLNFLAIKYHALSRTYGRLERKVLIILILSIVILHIQKIGTSKTKHDIIA